MAISGHKTRSVFDRYNIVSERDLREAACRLDRLARDRDAGRHGGSLVTVDSDRKEGAARKLLI